MKETLSICLGTFLVCCGLLLALGVESNFLLAIPMLICFGLGALCLRLASYLEKRHKQHRPRSRQVYRVYNYQTGRTDYKVA